MRPSDIAPSLPMDYSPDDQFDDVCPLSSPSSALSLQLSDISQSTFHSVEMLRDYPRRDTDAPIRSPSDGPLPFVAVTPPGSPPPLQYDDEDDLSDIPSLNTDDFGSHLSWPFEFDDLSTPETLSIGSLSSGPAIPVPTYSHSPVGSETPDTPRESPVGAGGARCCATHVAIA